jgi:acyl-CoA thioester hydrolase
MAAQVFRHKHRVTYAECTVGNHVYYGHYLALLEEARAEFFRACGMSFLRWQEEHDLILPVVECRMRYRTPAHYDEVLTIEVWLTEARKVRLIFAYRIANEAGEKVLEGETVHLATDTAAKIKRLPRDLIDRLRPFIHSEDKAATGPSAHLGD